MREDPLNAPSRFAFAGSDLAVLFRLAGRDDAATYRLVEDLEACCAAFMVLARGEHGRLPPKVAADLDGISRLAAALRSALYELPADVSLLLDLHVLSEGAQRRIGRDLERVTQPLEDLVAVMAEVRRDTDAQLQAGSTQIDQRLLSAIASSYRNRLNLRPSADDGGHFERFLRGVLELAAVQAPEFAALSRRVGTVQLAAACDGAAGRGPPLGRPLLQE
jgi:hypothetical protein